MSTPHVLSAQGLSEYSLNTCWDFPNPAAERAWRDFLGRAHLPSQYCAPDYFKEHFEAGCKPFAILAFDPDSEQVVRGVLTGYQNGREVHCGLEVRPQVALEPGGAAAEALVDGLLSAARGATLITATAWEPCPAFVVRGFSEKQEPGTVLLDLSRGPDALFAKFSDRASIRYAIKLGVEVREATDADIPAYYEMLSNWSGKKGIRCASASQFLQLFQCLPNRRLLLAFHQGALIAGSMLRFFPGGLVEYTANCSWPQYRHLRPNDLLQWAAIQWACRNGFSHYSLGSACHFHRKFGGSVVPIYRYQLDRSFLKWHERQEGLVADARRLYNHLPDAWRARIKALRTRLN